MRPLSLFGPVCIYFSPWSLAHAVSNRGTTETVENHGTQGHLMATMEIVEPQIIGDRRRERADEGGLAGLSIDNPSGGLIILGPTPGVVDGLEWMLGLPCVEGVELVATRMSSWQTVSNEVREVGRLASRVIRTGRTAVVHLDAHLGDAPAVPVDAREFVCTRLGQILIGIADTPAYVALHSERMAKALILDCLEDDGATTLGAIDEAYPVHQLTGHTMFAGLPIAQCPGDRSADALVRMRNFFETRRSCTRKK